jgi:multiple sugar transport system substrate-binding protein
MQHKRKIGLGVTVLAAFFLAQCAPAATPTPQTIIQTQVVVQTQVSVQTQVQVQTQVVVNTQVVQSVVTATPAPASGVVKVLIIGKPDQDTTDPVTGAAIPGLQHLHDMFEAAHPSIDMQIISIPWGDGSTGYSPKTEAMIQAQQACVYHMPAAFDFGKRGYLENLDSWMKNDPTFKNVWPGDALAQWRGWGPGNPDNQWGLPYSGDSRVIQYDATLFQQWGVAPLSLHPTLDELQTKAAKMTGKNPVTGEQNYGYWFQGKYTNWQFQSIAHAEGANWGQVNADGSWTINWNTPEYLKGLQWLVDMAKFAPPGALASDAMPDGFLTDQNVVAIIPEGEPGYYLQAFVANPDIQKRFRTVYNLQGADGKGGLSSTDPLAMAASCDNKPAAWEVMKWLAGSPESQKYNFDAGGSLPVIANADKLIPALGNLLDADPILNQNGSAEPRYPWASAEPRFDLQAAIEQAIAGTLTPQQALAQAQKQTDDWLKKQTAGAS